MSDEWRQQYQAYIRSPEWQSRRQMMFAKFGKKCMWCGDTRRLQVHHIHYHTLGHEGAEDLEIVCPGCHADADIQRAREGERRAVNALYAARLSGWATKKYGEDWVESADDSIAEEFQEWQERKDMSA